MPGYSYHNYNVLNFAFWFYPNNGGAYGTAAGAWEDIASYITDPQLINDLTGLTTATSKQLRSAIKEIYIAHDIQIFISAFGATNHPQSTGSDATLVGEALGNYAKTYMFDGADIDWEEGQSYFESPNNGQGEEWLSELTRSLSENLNADQKITHAPQGIFINMLFVSNGITHKFIAQSKQLRVSRSQKHKNAYCLQFCSLDLRCSFL